MEQQNLWEAITEQDPNYHASPYLLSWKEYGEVTKRDVFHYVNGMLHHPGYRERYAENLKRELPRIPLVRSREALWALVHLGARLMDLQLHYEQMPAACLAFIWTEGKEQSYRVEKMRLVKGENSLSVVVNESLTLAGIPPDVQGYRLGNRSVLEWVIDQHQITKDERSGIVSDPNREDDPKYIVRLIGQVVYVSLTTLATVAELEARVPIEEWTGTYAENVFDTGLA